VITKSDLILRDLDLLQQISAVYAAVSFTITTADDALSRKLEPGAPPSSARFAALRTLAEAGILTGVTMQPILPFLEDTVENITALVEMAHENGASYILPWFGMSLRAGSRDYYYRKLDQLFPGVREKYIKQYRGSYICNSPRLRQLDEVFQKLVYQHGIAIEIPAYTPEKITTSSRQMDLF
jgi:DNA repair photolyase